MQLRNLLLFAVFFVLCGSVSAQKRILKVDELITDGVKIIGLAKDGTAITQGDADRLATAAAVKEAIQVAIDALPPGGGLDSASQEVKPVGGTYLTGDVVRDSNGTLFQALQSNDSPGLNGRWAPLNEGVLLGDTVKMPGTDFDWFPGVITRNGELGYLWTYGKPNAFRKMSRVDTNFNGVLAEICYINPITGNDANDGLTEATAFRTINYGIGQLGNTGRCLHLSLAPGVYVEDEQFDGSVLGSRPYSLFCPEGIAVIGMWLNNPAWTLTSGGTYRATITNLNVVSGYVLDRTSQDDAGMFLQYAFGSSATELRPGQQFVQNDTLWIYPRSGGAPDPLVNTLITVGDDSFTPNGNHHFYGENLHVYGQTNASGNLTKLKAFLNCSFFYCRNDNTDQFRVPGVAYFNRCTFQYGQSDIVDYESDSRGIEWKCRFKYAGMKTPVGGESADQCSTAHGGALVVRGPGTYELYRSSGIYDINAGTKSVNVGCQMGSEREGYFTANTWPSIGVGPGAEMWIENVSFGGKLQLQVDEAILNVRRLNLTSASTVEIINNSIVRPW